MRNLYNFYFSTSDRTAIKESISEAESKTSGEIVVRVATRSKNWSVLLLTRLIVFGLLGFGIALLITSNSNWGWYFNFSQSIIGAGIGMLVGYLVWNFWTKRSGNLKNAIWEKAMTVFKQLPATKGGTGVLIFMALYENEVAILADEGIANCLDNYFWDGIYSEIKTSMRRGDHAEGIIDAIEDIGEELEQYFPRLTDDTNEIPDDIQSVD